MNAKSDHPEPNERYPGGAYDKARLSKARVISEDQLRSVREFSVENARENGFDDTEALRGFLIEMWMLMDIGSEVQIVDGSVVVPADQPEFKPTREMLNRLHEKLSEAAEVLRQVPENETMRAALEHSDQTGKLDEQYRSLLELLETSQKAASLQGRAGRRSNEQWLNDFCIACQRHWVRSGKTGTSIVFNTAFPTPITRWVESVYVGLRRLRGERDDLSKLKSAAKAVSVYRD